MEEYSRPATLEDLKTLIRAMNERSVDYLLIGGYALFAHGYHRATTDIDVLVPATRQAGKKVKDALMETYETLSRFAETVDLDGLPIRTVNLEGLLRTKQTMRDKDVADRAVLERALDVLRRSPRKP
ncbi:MAG: hypothetical protein HZC22_08530 [Rhodocyclales bacterium]|nr:hypothetical protein [Rhodocyclales bacterium]